MLKPALTSLLVSVYVCTCLAQLDMASSTQAMVPSESKTCTQMRDNLEQMLYTTYKASIQPQGLLKQILPALVEPLLPSVCLQGGSYVKRLQEVTSQTATTSRPKRQVGLFGMGGMVPRKDPGDHPPPGMARNPFKDPGDRPGGLFGMGPMKDPGDAMAAAAAGGGEGAPPPSGEPMDPAMSSMMTMARMFSMNNQRMAMARMAARQPVAPVPSPMVKTFRNGFYGDPMPNLGRKKRSIAEEEEDEDEDEAPLVRHKRANGEEEMKGGGFNPFGFGNFLFSDRPDHRSASAPMFPPFFFPFYPAPRRSRFSWGRPGPARANAAYRPNSPVYSRASAVPSQPVIQQLSRRNSLGRPVYGDAPPSYTRSSPFAPRSPAFQTFPNNAFPAQSPPAANFPAPAAAQQPPPPQQPAAAPSQPLAGLPASGQPLTPPAGGQPAAALSAMAQTQPAAAAAPGPVISQPLNPNGMIYGDTLPTFTGTAATAGRRVKRASSEESSSSDPSPADVVTFGDMTIPTDTFNNMINPRGGKSDDYNPPPRYAQSPPPAYYHPPPPRPYYPPPQFHRSPYYPAARRGFYPTKRMGYFPPNRMAYPPPRYAPLPMGAAQPLIYGTRPAY